MVRWLAVAIVVMAVAAACGTTGRDRTMVPGSGPSTATETWRFCCP